MKTLMVDMDGVLTHGIFTKLIEDFLGYVPDYDNFKGYYLQDLLKDKKDEFFKSFKDMNIYENAELIPYCYDVLKKLSKVYEIYICTDYIWREIPEYAGNNLKNKYEYLYEKFDFINPRNYIFTADKSVVNCDVKIDDKLENLTGDSVKLLFNAYHNAELDEEKLKSANVIRVNDWKDIEEILLNEK